MPCQSTLLTEKRYAQLIKNMPNWTKLSHARQDFSFLLFEPFSNHVLANVLEPLRAANDLLGREVYRWQFLTLDGQPVESSSGLPVSPHAVLGEEKPSDYLVLLPSYGYRQLTGPALRRGLRAAAKRHLCVMGLDCGAWLMADAELLDGYRATIHPEEHDAFAEHFPDVRADRLRWVIDDDRITAGGALPGFELMLHLIGEAHGTALTLEIASLFVSGSSGQSPGLIARDPVVAQVVELMHAHIERPWTIAEIAAVAGLTQVQIDRRFRAGLGASPRSVYSKLRLDAAKRMTTQTDLSVTEIGLRVGYENTASFCRAFKRAFGKTPGQWRVQGATGGRLGEKRGL